MRWQQERRSENVEDRRGIRPAGLAVGGGIGTLIIVLLAIFLGRSEAGPECATEQPAGRRTAPNQAPVPGNAAEEKKKDFVAVVLG